MALVSKSISNLIGGVSQQPDAVRFDNQCDAQDNAFPSVLDGLTKRQPTEHVANITGDSSPLDLTKDAEDFFVHTINRSASSRYLAILEADTISSNLKVVDTDGTVITVTEATTDAFDYLQIHADSSLTADTAIRAITIADYTFIVNRTKVVEMAADVVTARNPEALVFVRQGAYGTQYSWTVGDTTNSYTTHNSTASTVSTKYIAQQLDGDDGIPSGTTISRNGSVIWVQSTDSTDFDITGDDGIGDTGLVVIKDETQRLTDLPTKAPHGFTIKIVGEATDTRDDYYVKFEADNSDFGTGVWKESTPTNITYKFDATTMPHVLIRKSATEFLFAACDATDTIGDDAVANALLLPDWGERNCGDEESNSDPTFVTKTINDIFLFKNRLGILADENVILSESAEFFNFWRTTVTDVLPTDAIDVASTHSAVSILTAAIPFHKQLVLFSDQTQFLLGSAGALSPNTVTMTKTTNYSSVSHIRPVTAGHSIYFGFNRGGYTGIRQYFLSGSIESIFDAEDISGQVPQYIEGDLRDMAGSSHEDILFALTNDNRNILYAYKYFDRGTERLQSSWSRFVFADDDAILGIEFIDTSLYMVVKRTDGFFLDKLEMASGLTDTGSTYRTLLDKRCDQSVAIPAYNATTDETTITLPYKAYTASPIEMITKSGRRVAIKTQTDASPTVVVDGDFSATAADTDNQTYFIGQKYEMVYTFSDVVMREPSDSGGQNTIAEGRVQVRYLTLSYASTGYFSVELTPDYRDKSTHPFTGRILGAGNNLIGSIPLDDGNFKVPVYSKADQVTIECKNDTPLPCAISSVEFELSLNARAKRYS